MSNITMKTVNEVKQSLKHLAPIDYIILLVILLISSVAGLYYGFRTKPSRKFRRNVNNSADDEASTEEVNYFVGGRNMKTFPVAMSMVASFVSGVSILGTPTEVYLYGINYSYILVAMIVISPFQWYVSLPIFHELKVTSAYEYLELRFSKKVRRFGSIIFCINMMILMPIVVFVPALVLNQVAGVSIYASAIIVCGVCILYTSLGGIKAVISTDVFQATLMVSALIVILFLGTNAVGGIGKVWQQNWQDERLDSLNMTLDPYVRYSFLSLIICGPFAMLHATGVNQGLTQRYVSLPSIKAARHALSLFVIGMITMQLLCIYAGLLLHATYYDCDPLTTKLAKNDQLLPLLIMDKLRDIPGLPGFFIGGILCAALSTLSTALNSLTAVIFKDLWQPLMGNRASQVQSLIVMRIIVVLFGCYCMGMVFIVEKLGPIYQLMATMISVTAGAECGLYIIGFFFPCISTKSALTGSIVSLCSMFYICISWQLAIVSVEGKWPTKPTRVDNCSYNFTTTKVSVPNESKPSEYQPMSMFLFPAIGITIAVVVALISNFVYGARNSRDVDPKLLAPFIRKLFQSRIYRIVPHNGTTQENRRAQPDQRLEMVSLPSA